MDAYCPDCYALLVPLANTLDWYCERCEEIVYAEDTVREEDA